jgi:hypothetical protein
MPRKLLLAGCPYHVTHFKDYWWCKESAVGKLIDSIPDNVQVETIDPVCWEYVGATKADHVTSVWDGNFHNKHKDSYEYVILPDLDGPWSQTQYENDLHALIILIEGVMNLVKPGGYGVFDKIFRMRDEMNAFIRDNVFAFYPFLPQQYEKPDGKGFILTLRKRGVALH